MKSHVINIDPACQISQPPNPNPNPRCTAVFLFFLFVTFMLAVIARTVPHLPIFEPLEPFSEHCELPEFSVSAFNISKSTLYLQFGKLYIQARNPNPSDCIIRYVQMAAKVFYGGSPVAKATTLQPWRSTAMDEKFEGRFEEEVDEEDVKEGNGGLGVSKFSVRAEIETEIEKTSGRDDYEHMMMTMVCEGIRVRFKKVMDGVELGTMTGRPKKCKIQPWNLFYRYHDED